MDVSRQLFIKYQAITTIEGLLQTIIDNIQSAQEIRKKQTPELYEKLEEFIIKLKNLFKVEKPFKLVLDDPSGNGIIENFYAPKDDPNIKIEKYNRTKEQNNIMGFYQDEGNLDAVKEEDEIDVPEEVFQFQSPCPNCGNKCKVNMKPVEIPHFKEIIIMALNCDACGCRENEVKAGGGIEPKGRRFELRITCESDLKRDVLKSDTGGVRIPEIDFEATHGTLSGKFTTIEGILISFYENLSERNPFVFGDSADTEKKKVAEIVEKIKQISQGKITNVTFILDDPAGNSYLQNYYAPDPDPEMKVIDYERNEEQNDFLGLTGMNTKDFENIL